MEINKSKKIIVAISGGVDSSVSAALLKKAGYEVSGVFMRLHNLPQSKESERRAKIIAKVLKIPFFVLDLRREFKEKIIKDFLKEYKNGRTPNPCVICNREIKFGLFLKKALEMKADFIATGHYVRKQETESREKKIEYKLLRAKDKGKDQSYFLWQLSQAQLKKAIFPLGNLIKSQVKNLAKKFKLPVLNVRESQEICFIKTTVNDFLKKNLRQKPGIILDEKGKIIGNHQGLAFYTIGQRKRIGLPGGPYFVFGKDLKNNILKVTKKEEDLFRKELVLKNVNLISGKNPYFPLKVKAKIRYRSDLAPAIVYKEKNGYKTRFTRPQKAITPGQSAVFYSGKGVLGGGVIN